MGMDVYGANEGTYFRANCWSWRPICVALANSGAADHLDNYNWELMAENSGGGARSEDACLQMADDLEEWTNENVEDTYSPDVFENEDGTNYYGTSKDHLLEFVRFLRKCGDGFEVW